MSGGGRKRFGRRGGEPAGSGVERPLYRLWLEHFLSGLSWLG